MRRIGLIGLLVLLGSVSALLLQGTVLPQPAAAEKCETCEEEEPPVEEEVLETLTVKVEGAGSVSDGAEIICSSSAFSSNTCEAEYAFGEEVTLSPMPMPGMTFLGWSGSCSGTGGCSVTMTGARSVTAQFADKTPPPSPNISSPTSEQLFEWESGTVKVEFTGFEAVAFYCGLDNSSFATAVGCGSPWLIKDPAEGTHTVYVWAKDSAGHVSSPASRSFKVVITSPAEEPGDEPGPGGPGGTPGTGGTPTTTQPPSTGAQTTSLSSRIDVKLVAKTRSVGRATVFRRLMLRRVPQGPFALASCKGDGCPFRKKKIHVNSGIADLSPLFAGRELGPGTVIRLLAGGPEGTTETITLRIRAGKAPRVTKSWHASPVT